MINAWYVSFTIMGSRVFLEDGTISLSESSKLQKTLSSDNTEIEYIIDVIKS